MALAATVAILRPLRLDLGLTNIALILLLLSVVIAAAWGWVAGVYTSLLSNLAFNFFFVPPLYRFTVQQPDNALALGLFLLVAAIAASLLARARRSALEARRQARDTQTLLALSRTTRDRSLQELPEAICEWIVRDFALRSCTLFQFTGDDLEPVAGAGRSLSALDRAERSVALQAARSGRPAGLGYRLSGSLLRRPAGNTGQLYLPLRLERETIGVLQIETAGASIGHDRERLLEAFADEAAGSLHRVALAASARAADELRETDKLRSSLLSSVSHDLRTPLTAIKASVANLLSPEVDWSPQARREFLGAIDRETDRLTRLVTNLLDLSRIEAGALRLDLDWNDLEELLRNAVYRAERSFPDHTFDLTFEGSLPLFQFDYVQVDRVLANLIENAVKYSPPGSRIDLRASAALETVTVEVRDRGSGIAPQDRTRVFSAFYRSELSSGAAGGSGLGLAICRGIVGAHGGRIWAENDSGAVLRFTLPIRVGREEAGPTGPPRSEDPHPSLSGHLPRSRA
jgi:two-component system sensor histidine kinase KdpD